MLADIQTNINELEKAQQKNIKNPKTRKYQQVALSENRIPRIPPIPTV